jgi:hypothetical protein
LKKKKERKTGSGGVTQMVEQLFGKHKALNSNSHIEKKKKRLK